MSCRTFLLAAPGLAALLIGIYLAIACVIDPFNLYHPLSPSRYISIDQHLARQAVPRSPAYDSYFVGSSISQEFVPADFNKALNAHFAHLTLSAASSYEDLNILRLLPSKHYRYLVLELYFHSFSADLHATFYPNYPAYLYDENRFNDFEAYLTCDAFMLRELSRAYYRNFRGIDKDPGGDRPTPDGYFSWDPQKERETGRVRDRVAVVWKFRDQRLKFSAENFRAILSFAAPRFEHLLLFFPPVHADSLRAQFIIGPRENMKNYLAWKKEVIALASGYPQVVLIDYQTINPYTERDENYFDFNHSRANVRRMILEDFESWIKFHRLAHPDFGRLADRAYGRGLSPGSLFFEAGAQGSGKTAEGD